MKEWRVEGWRVRGEGWRDGKVNGGTVWRLEEMNWKV